jgi:hypothetical protein
MPLIYPNALHQVGTASIVGASMLHIRHQHTHSHTYTHTQTQDTCTYRRSDASAQLARPLQCVCVCVFVCVCVLVSGVYMCSTYRRSDASAQVARPLQIMPFASSMIHRGFLTSACCGSLCLAQRRALPPSAKLPKVSTVFRVQGLGCLGSRV